jgi:hypothetical protein
MIDYIIVILLFIFLWFYAMWLRAISGRLREIIYLLDRIYDVVWEIKMEEKRKKCLEG